MAKDSSFSIKQSQIKNASAKTFISVAVASVIVSISVVLLNILWNTSKYNARTQDLQTTARNTLKDNIEVVKELEKSFTTLELSSKLIPDQSIKKSNSELVLDALPSKYDFPALVSSINNLAQRSAVKLTSFQGVDLGSSAEQSSTKPVPIDIPFNIEVEGKYDSIAKFLKGMESSIRPMKVMVLNLSGTDSRIHASLTVETYYQPAFDLSIEKRVVE